MENRFRSVCLKSFVLSANLNRFMIGQPLLSRRNPKKFFQPNKIQKLDLNLHETYLKYIQTIIFNKIMIYDLEYF